MPSFICYAKGYTNPVREEPAALGRSPITALINTTFVISDGLFIEVMRPSLYCKSLETLSGLILILNTLYENYIEYRLCFFSESAGAVLLAKLIQNYLKTLLVLRLVSVVAV